MVTGCGDDPFVRGWEVDVDTVTLFSLQRPELDIPTAFGFRDRLPIQIEDPTASGQWDLAVDTQGDVLVFLPPGALNINSRARIARLTGATFETLAEAPRDTTRFSATEPVPISTGTVYVVRTGERVFSGIRCIFFAKLEPVEIDVETGFVEFFFDVNPNCNDDALIPPDTD